MDESFYWIPRRTVHVGCLVLAVLAFTLVVGLGFWLRTIAGFLIIAPSPLAPADAIVVLGGGQPEGARESRAADLFRRGLAPTVLTTGGPVLGEARATYADFSVQRLVRRGVPRAAIVATNVGDSTVTDARGARLLAERNGWRSLIVVTDNWHSRRVALAFDFVFAGSPIAIAHAPAPSPRFSPDAWWLDETSALFVLSEYVKLGAFLIGYPPETYGAAG